MRLARVLGQVTLNQRTPELKNGALLICEAMDAAGLEDPARFQSRQKPMPESLVVFDRHGAGVGDLIAFTEGGEAAQPFRPEKVPVDAYCAAIIDTLNIK
jgi:microcompartment protein CcmK/EutM